jgi:hypothetical protein
MPRSLDSQFGALFTPEKTGAESESLQLLNAPWLEGAYKAAFLDTKRCRVF